jgi:tetratricopeptide (TPR) repeat protein
VKRPSPAAACALAIALLAIAPYLPSLGGGFVFDDQLQIVENDQIRSLRNLPAFFGADVWAAIGVPYSSYYRPLMYTTFAIETAIAGPVPWIFRVTNLSLHVGVSLSLLVLMRRAGGSLAAAAVGAALFAVHPMHAEVVAWPSARPDLLMALFALCAAIVYLGSDVERGPALGRFLAVGALVMGALLAKESGVAAPVLLGAAVLMRSSRPSPLGRIANGLSAALPYVALVAVFLGIRGLAIRVPGMPPLVGDDPLRFPFASWPEAIRHVTAIAGRYLGGMLVPIEASFFRVPSWEHVRWGLALLPLGVAAIAASPWSRAATWLAFAFLAIAVQSTGIPSAGYLSQRYAYLPSAGVCAALGEAIAWAFFAAAASARRRRVGYAITAAVVLAWSALLVPRSLEWADEERLWRAAYPRDPDDSAAVLTNYAYLLVDEGRAGDAIPLFRRVAEIEPGSWAGPHGEANALVALGRPREAIPLYRKAIASAPMIPQLRQALAAAHEDLGELDEARRIYAEALELFPESALSHGMLGTVLARAKNHEEALRSIEQALAIRPDDPRLRVNRAIVLAELGRLDEAIAANEAMLGDPLLAAEADYNLGILYDRYRVDPPRALAHYEASLRRAPDRANADVVRARIEALRAKTRGAARSPTREANSAQRAAGEQSRSASPARP